jgi:hypothetical protein
VTACSFHTAIPEPSSRKTHFLVGVNADILIPQEVDLNARHTHRLNIANPFLKIRVRFAVLANVIQAIVIEEPLNVRTDAPERPKVDFRGTENISPMNSSATLRKYAPSTKT